MEKDKLGRRKALKLISTASSVGAAGVAGCLNGDIDFISIDIIDLKPVQGVSDSRMIGFSDQEDIIYTDPPLASNKKAAVVLDVEFDREVHWDWESFPDPVEVTFIVDGDESSVKLDDSDFEDLGDLEEYEGKDVPIGRLDGLEGYSAPIFTPTSFTEEITVEISSEGDWFDGDTETIRQSDGDFEVQHQPSLDIGFVGIKNAFYGRYWDPELFDTDYEIDFNERYEQTVEKAIKELEKWYPTWNLRVYMADPADGDYIHGIGDWEYDDPLGDPRPDETDAKEAKDFMENLTPISYDDVDFGRGMISDFDEIVAILPSGDDDLESYSSYHFSGTDMTFNGRNVLPTDEHASLAHVGTENDWLTHEQAAQTVNHEVGHHFLGALFQDYPRDHPDIDRDEEQEQLGENHPIEEIYIRSMREDVTQEEHETSLELWERGGQPLYIDKAHTRFVGNERLDFYGVVEDVGIESRYYDLEDDFQFNIGSTVMSYDSTDNGRV